MTGDLQVNADVQSRNNTVDDETLFAITDFDNTASIKAKFYTTSGAFTKVDDSTAPASGVFKVTGGFYATFGEYIPMDAETEIMFECWVKHVSGTDSQANLYAGGEFYNGSKSSYGNVNRYWGANGDSQDSDNTTWRHIKGVMKGSSIRAQSSTSDAQYMRLLVLLNYNAGSNASHFCGMKWTRSKKTVSSLWLKTSNTNYNSDSSLVSTEAASAFNVIDTSGNIKSLGTLTFSGSSGTMINTGAQSDAFGYNSSYGHYIRGNSGTYLYGNGTLYTGGAARTLFHDTYHPNADTLTTARTISLAGNVTGSVSFNGSSNVSITTALAANSVAASEIAAGAVGASEIGNDVVNSQHYAAGSIDNEHIADNAINSEHYADNSIDALHLNVSGNGNTSQYLRSDGDGTMSWVTPPNTNTTYSAGTGISLSGTTFSHSDTSSQASSSNSGRTYIQSINLDGLGHINGISTATETVVNTNTNTTYSGGTGITLSGTTFNLTDTASKLNLSGGTMTGTLNSRDIKLGSGYHLMRSNHYSGHLEGSYNSVGANSTKSNPIYTIGSSYNPSDSALGGMYGIGYTNTGASFISLTGAAGWGMYVAADGDARVWLDGSNGVISSTGQHYVGSSRVFHDTYHPNADVLTTSRYISLGGDLSGSGQFNGGSDITITAALTANSVGASEIAANAVGASEIAANAVGASEISASAVGASELNVSGNGSTSQFLRSDGDGTFTWATPTDTNTVYTLPTTISGTRNFSGLISANAGLRLGDNDKLQLGDSQDLEINHYSVGQITNKTGDLYISSTAANTDIIFYAAIGATPTEFYRMNGGTGKNTFSRPVDISANLTATGDVGIGTSNPTELLHVRKAQSTSAATNPFIKLHPTSTTNSTGLTSIFLSCTTASGAYGISLNGWRDPTNSEAFAIKTHSGSANGTNRLVIRKNGYVGIGTDSPSSKLQVNGTLTATTKNFLIDNPKTGGELQYSVIESNEHGVCVRGESDQEEVQLPIEWEWLVHEDSVTVQLTSVGQAQSLFVLERNNVSVKIGGLATGGKYSYVIYGTRKDVEPLEVNI